MSIGPKLSCLVKQASIVNLIESSGSNCSAGSSTGGSTSTGIGAAIILESITGAEVIKTGAKDVGAVLLRL